ncbi:hypothetical protein L6164_029494 [Bauhinia variegata]|uniref:Uncharacterized protein n=1 Tax=Bauhinia variegata TaxID=167791 RepID=A0ACB9L9I0_BAUVA|nr:hypothetical protein L6164_029494 [Bauhinia variegata]
MEVLVFGVQLLVLFVSVFFMWVEVDLAEGGNVRVNAGKYISWDDLKVDERRLRLNSNNEDRVIVVDQHGRGHSRTVQGAVDMVPEHNKERVKVYIYPGIYREKVFVPKSKPYVSLIGKINETAEVVITWNSKASDKSSSGQELGTFGSATVGVDSDYFCAAEITFQARKG